jgi:hypothetical protein
MEILTRRIGKVIAVGNTLGMSLREEILGIGLDEGKEAMISVMENNGEKRIEIKKANT